jgi:hypothetical protein
MATRCFTRYRHSIQSQGGDAEDPSLDVMYSVHDEGRQLECEAAGCVLCVLQAANESLPMTARWLCEHGYTMIRVD